MASRYWIGNDGDFSDTDHWSTSSGGSGGASVPGTNDTAIFDENSFTEEDTPEIAISTTVQCSFNASGATGLFMIAIGEGGSLTLKSALSGPYLLDVIGGTLNTGNYNISVTDGVDFLEGATVNLGTSTITIGQNYVIQPGYYCDDTVTLDADQASIVLYAHGAYDPLNDTSSLFVSYGHTYSAVSIIMGGNDCTLEGSNTQGALSITGDGNLVCNYDGENATQTISTSSGLTLQGSTSGGLKIKTYTGQVTFSMASGSCSPTNCKISDTTATGGATFTASTSLGNTRGSNLTGWNSLAYYKLLSNPGLNTLIGSSVALLRNIPLQASDVGLSLAGQDINITAERHVLANNGAISVTSNNVALSDTRYHPPGNAAGIFSDFEVGSHIDLDVMMWGTTGAGGWALAADAGAGLIDGAAVNIQATRKITMESGSLPVAGSTVSLNRNVPLPAAAGEISPSGTQITIKTDRRLPTSSGAINTAGSTVSLCRDIALEANSGETAISGVDVALKTGRSISTSSGAIISTGIDVGLRYTGGFIVAGGSFSVAGADVGLKRDFTISASPGEVSEDGANIGIYTTRIISTSSGEIIKTGYNVDLVVSRKINAATEAFLLSGQSATMTTIRRMNADPTSLSETGMSVELLAGRLIQSLFCDVSVSGSSLGLQRLAHLLISSGALNLTGQNVDLYSLGIRVGAGELILSGADLTLSRGRAYQVETVHSMTKNRRAVAVEKINRATAPPRVTGA